MTLLSWDIPLISFNGSLWDVLLRCSKWLLGRGLIASQWSWDADWSSESNEPAPLSLWHCDPDYVQLKSGSIERTAHFMGRPTPLKVNGANFSTLLPPRGATFTPFWGMVLQSLPASSCGQFHISVKSTLELRGVNFFFAMLSQWGNFGTLLPPRGATFTPFWGVVVQSLPASSNVANFTFLWNPLSELRGVQSFRHVKSMRLILPLFCPWGKHRTPIAYKVIAQRSRLAARFTPHSWLLWQNCGRSSAPKKWKKKNN